MQPYFYPYPGYYRLLAAADVLVLFDCVQFPRRGRVHRTAGVDRSGRSTWLTLPLAKAPRATAIKDMAFSADATAAFEERLARSTWLRPTLDWLPPAIAAHVNAPLLDVVDYLEAGLVGVAEYLGLPARIIRSSSLSVDPGLRGQDRVLAICEQLGAKAYVNAPGGRGLYNPSAFAARGIDLRFLPPYQGQPESMLQALAREDGVALRHRLGLNSGLVH
jgi:hypothetical protein